MTIKRNERKGRENLIEAGIMTRKKTVKSEGVVMTREADKIVNKGGK